VNNESLQKPIVTIIDRDEIRRTAMQNAFKNIAKVQYGFNPGGGSKNDFRADSSGALLKEFASSVLTLRHIGDSKFDTQLKTGLTVYYSGNGGDDRRYKELGDFKSLKRIWRAVSGKLGVLTEMEAQRLIDFARNFQTNPQATEPEFLNPPKTISAISALFVLCQGYLAVYAAHLLKEGNEENERDADRLIKKLQRRSDDSAQKSLRALLTPALAARLPQVSSPQFWRKPFLASSGGETLDGFDVALFSKKVDDERMNLYIGMEDFAKIKRLPSLFDLPENDKTPISESVENAYDVLEKALKGRDIE
jgi:hypothetical protein